MIGSAIYAHNGKESFPSSVSNCHLLQDDLSCLYDWTVAWPVHLNPAKCEAFNISFKLSPPQFTYTINGETISWKPLVEYLGIYVNSKLTWSDHCKLIASKATRILNILRITMCGCSALAKDVALSGIHGVCLCGVESPDCMGLCFA